MKRTTDSENRIFQPSPTTAAARSSSRSPAARRWTDRVGRLERLLETMDG